MYQHDNNVFHPSENDEYLVSTASKGCAKQIVHPINRKLMQKKKSWADRQHIYWSPKMRIIETPTLAFIKHTLEMAVNILMPQNYAENLFISFLSASNSHMKCLYTNASNQIKFVPWIPYSMHIYIFMLVSVRILHCLSEWEEIHLWNMFNCLYTCEHRITEGNGYQIVVSNQSICIWTFFCHQIFQ